MRTGAGYFDKLLYCECGTRAQAGGDHNDVSTAPGYAATLRGSGGSYSEVWPPLSLSKSLFDRDSYISPSFSLTVMARRSAAGAIDVIFLNVCCLFNDTLPKKI